VRQAANNRPKADKDTRNRSVPVRCKSLGFTPAPSYISAGYICAKKSFIVRRSSVSFCSMFRRLSFQLGPGRPKPRAYSISSIVFGLCRRPLLATPSRLLRWQRMQPHNGLAPLAAAAPNSRIANPPVPVQRSPRQRRTLPRNAFCKGISP
jgi:hypothetical protein